MRIPDSQERAMAEATRNKCDTEEPLKRHSTETYETLAKSEIKDFVTTFALNFFTIFKKKSKFLEVDSALWKHRGSQKKFTYY